MEGFARRAAPSSGYLYLFPRATERSPGREGDRRGSGIFMDEGGQCTVGRDGVGRLCILRDFRSIQ